MVQIQLLACSFFAILFDLFRAPFFNILFMSCRTYIKVCELHDSNGRTWAANPARRAGTSASII